MWLHSWIDKEDNDNKIYDIRLKWSDMIDDTCSTPNQVT